MAIDPHQPRPSSPAARGPCALKVDVDTYEGMAHGVPRLLDLFAAHRLRATFFLVLGPDRSGMAVLQALRSPRFVAKMIATGAPSLYGWRTMLSGTVLPARPVAPSFPALVRRIAAEGHELAVHAWDHRAWQDDLPRFAPSRIHAHFARAIAAFRALTGSDPAGVGAPAWMTTPESLRCQDRFACLRYASDLRGGPPCRLTVDGQALRLPQLPGTGPCTEELLAQGVTAHAALAARLEREVLDAPAPLRVLTLHAEVEGGLYQPVLEALIPRLARERMVTMGEAAAELADRLPLRRWRMRRLAGRAFPVSSSRPLAGAAA